MHKITFPETKFSFGSENMSLNYMKTCLTEQSKLLLEHVKSVRGDTSANKVWAPDADIVMFIVDESKGILRYLYDTDHIPWLKFLPERLNLKVYPAMDQFSAYIHGDPMIVGVREISDVSKPPTKTKFDEWLDIVRAPMIEATSKDIMELIKRLNMVSIRVVSETGSYSAVNSDKVEVPIKEAVNRPSPDTAKAKRILAALNIMKYPESDGLPIDIIGNPKPTSETDVIDKIVALVKTECADLTIGMENLTAGAVGLRKAVAKKESVLQCAEDIAFNLIMLVAACKDPEVGAAVLAAIKEK